MRLALRAAILAAGVMALPGCPSDEVAEDGGEDSGAVVAADDPTTTSTPEAPTTRPQEAAVDGQIVPSGDLPHGPVWSVTQPPGWFRLAYTGASSFELSSEEISGYADCRSNVLSVNPGHARVGIGAGPLADWEPLPQFTPPIGPTTPFSGSDDPLCDLAPEGTELYVGRFALNDARLYVSVVFAGDVGEVRRQQAWDVVNSITPRAGGAGAPACITTAAEPSLDPPDPWPDNPSNGVWWGRPELWTVLQTDGIHVPSRSAWWSQNFPGGAVEEQPRIQVSWANVYDPSYLWPEIESPPIGTNAHTPEEGDFMIQGFDPAGGGCWQETGVYKGSSLSYTYWQDPHLLVQEEQTPVDAEPIEGVLVYDQINDCVQLRHGGVRATVVWPVGTTITTDGAIQVSDGTILTLGDHISGEGSYRDASQAGVEVAELCRSPDGDAVLWSNAPVTVTPD